METLRSAMQEIWQHALRSTLTLAGIVLGCLALVVMTSVMDGVTGSVLEGFRDLGFDGVFGIETRSPSTPEERMLFAGSRGLVREDLAALRSRAHEIAGLTGSARASGVLSANGSTRAIRLLGVEPDYKWIRNRTPSAGRFLSESDIHTSARVAILGITLKKDLFGVEDPIGSEITIDDKRFLVIGVGRSLGNSWFREGMFRDEMEGITIPLTTLLTEFRGGGPIDSIQIKVRNQDDLEAARAEVSRILLARHHGIRDFEVEDMAGEVLRARENTKKQVGSWRIVMLAVAGVTLVVGGVGLLSVLLISLAERTYEIGLRKALGATGPAIFALFLAESLLLASLGAALGVAFGVVATRLASRGFPDGLPLSMGGVLIAVAAALFVGLAFGIGPALRASGMEPVEALREQG